LRLPAGFTGRPAGESFESLPLMASHTRQVSLLRGRHHGPFDRMLVAQAHMEKLVLLTADEALTAYGDAVSVAR